MLRPHDAELREGDADFGHFSDAFQRHRRVKRGGGREVAIL